jgi:aminoglycoside phosphotransferase
VKRPLISVLIPCFNAAPWIESTLRSVRKQTWSEVEIIVVDDGSTDGSYALARNFASPRCQVVRQERGGASAARNHAFRLAQGDYFQYLDADDLLATGKLECQMRAIDWAQSEELSFGSVIHFFQPGEAGESRLHLACIRGGRDAPAEFLADLWSGTGPLEMVQTGQWLTPRALIEKAGPWNEELSVDDDGEFFARVILAATRVLAVPEACAYYRKFRAGANLSSRAHANRPGRCSAVRAAELKSSHLLQHTSCPEARHAVRRMLTEQIISAYPAHPDLVEQGLRFLHGRDLRMADRLEGSPWFCRLHPWIGWKAARRLQLLRRTVV